jgi:molybdate transport system substrate-binding protein
LERRVALALAGLLAVAVPAVGGSGDVVVFAAASLTDALSEIGAAFEARGEGHPVFSFAGSNDLARQIRAGAPADVFISASVERMAELEGAGLVRAADRVDLLSNRLVVVEAKGAPERIRVPGDLRGVKRLALGDPEAVPAGIYARQWLTARGLWDGVKEKVVPTLDVRAALAAVASGAADAGIVYRTDAAISPRVRVALEVPADEGPRIVYAAALVARARGPAPRAFFRFLRSPEARRAFEEQGFSVLPVR